MQLVRGLLQPCDRAPTTCEQKASDSVWGAQAILVYKDVNSQAKQGIKLLPDVHEVTKALALKTSRVRQSHGRAKEE